MKKSPTTLTIRVGVYIGKMKQKQKLKGPLRESNSGPPAPEAGIMPLDQVDSSYFFLVRILLIACNLLFAESSRKCPRQFFEIPLVSKKSRHKV
jgi:hypothetical protein